MLVIASVAPWLAVVKGTITKFMDHVRMRLISQLIKGFSRVLQKLLRYFNGTYISTLFVPSLPVWHVIFSLALNKLVLLVASKLSVVPGSVKAYSPLYYFRKRLVVFE